MIPEFFVLFFFYHFGCVANLIIKRAIFYVRKDFQQLHDVIARYTRKWQSI